MTNEQINTSGGDASTEPLVEKQFTVWSEGYAATGEHGTATMMGTSSGLDFKDACVKLFKQLAEERPTEKERKEYERLFDPEKLTFWACKLFDNEEEARKSFG